MKLEKMGSIAALSAAVCFAGCPEGGTVDEGAKTGKIETRFIDSKPVGQRILVGLPAECKKLLDADVVYSHEYIVHSDGYTFYAKCIDSSGDVAIYASCPFCDAWDKITFFPAGAEDTGALDKRIKESSDDYIRQVEDSGKKLKAAHPELFRRQ